MIGKNKPTGVVRKSASINSTISGEIDLAERSDPLSGRLVHTLPGFLQHSGWHPVHAGGGIPPANYSLPQFPLCRLTGKALTTFAIASLRYKPMGSIFMHQNFFGMGLTHKH
jgi:hypothetical protein